MLERNEFVKSFISRDRTLLWEDSGKKPVWGKVKSDVEIITDFTEYSPLHRGHLHCMMEAKRMVPDGIFTAVVPGPLERSGRGLPYIMTRQARAEAAVAVGADIVVEGPPMGVMGSGQYSLCLAKMFKALDADYIPRGYKPLEGFGRILKKIESGVGVAPKPYKIVDMETKEVLMKGKLDEDNYVIVSLSKSLTKIGFDFKDKFIFIKRIEGVSGTKIREAVISGELEDVEDMLPSETAKILKDEMENNKAPLHDVRDVEGILQTANEKSRDYIKSLSMMDDKTADNLFKNRPMKTIKEVQNSISRGFSRHRQQRVISSLEARIHKDTIHRYIENYPSVIRILNYKNEDILKKFKKRIPHRRLEIWQ
jgi:predicted nucleotidyltransferase